MICMMKNLGGSVLAFTEILCKIGNVMDKKTNVSINRYMIKHI